MPYITLNEVKTYGDFESTNDDSLLTNLISDAQGIIEGITKRKFEGSASNRYFDAITDIDERTLLLDEDLCSISSITNGDGVVLTSGEYVTEDRNDTPFWGITLKSSSNKSWTYETDPENAITVSGVWAYSSTPPSDIHIATLRLVSWLYKQRETTVDLERATVTPEGQTLMPARLPYDIYSTLMRYKKPKIRGV